MSTFWPTDLSVTDLQSPWQILNTAREEWEAESGGAMTLILEKAESNGNAMIIVYGQHIPSNRTASLFSVIHRMNANYPVTIQPKDDDVPLFLQKSYVETVGGGLSGLVEMSKIVSGARTERTVKNEWVCDTPSEFRAKLKKVFNLGAIKSEIINLISTGEENLPLDTDEATTE